MIVKYQLEPEVGGFDDDTFLGKLNKVSKVVSGYTWYAFGLCLILNTVLAFKDPGYLTKEKRHSKVSEDKNHEDDEFLDLLRTYDASTLCFECKLLRTPRSRHCFQCNRCID